MTFSADFEILGKISQHELKEGGADIAVDNENKEEYIKLVKALLPGRVAQSVTCLATDACLTAIPGVASSIPARSHTFVEIDHEIISTVILLPSAGSFKKGCCQLQAKVCSRITGYPLVQACPGKSVAR